MWVTEWPHDLQSWALVASALAISQIHIDAGSLGTWVQILLGEKIWYIATKHPLPTKENGWSTDPADTDPNAWEWKAVVLRRGDTLYGFSSYIYLKFD